MSILKLNHEGMVLERGGASTDHGEGPDAGGAGDSRFTPISLGMTHHEVTTALPLYPGAENTTVHLGVP